MGEKTFISGDEAVAYGAVAAGCRFFGGYPISPSSEVAETMAELLKSEEVCGQDVVLLEETP